MTKTEYSKIGEVLFSETLPNGLRVLTVPKPGYAKSFAVFATRYGGADRRFRLNGQWLDTPAGIAHYLEHKMFDMPDGSNALPLLSARGASPNAFTGADMTAYHFSCTEGFYDNLKTLLEYVSTPYYTAESVAKEQGIIGQEIRMGEDDPGHACWYGLLQALYAEHPMRDPIGGTVESIAEITPETLYNCHKVFYNPSNMVLCCVGDVDPERICAMAKEMLPKERGEVPERDYGKEQGLFPAALRSERTMPVSAPQFLAGCHLALPESSSGRMRLSVLSDLALDYLCGPSSPLFNRLYADGLLTHDFGSEVYFCAGTATALFGGESRDPEAVISAFCSEINAMAGSGPDKDRFERCRRAAFGGAIQDLNRFSALGTALAACAFHGWNPLEELNVMEKLCADDVVSFLCENITPERLAMSVIRPAGTN